jgi:hypothetical protein
MFVSLENGPTESSEPMANASDVDGVQIEPAGNLICTNGHDNCPDARFCSTCGVNTFRLSGTPAAVSFNRMAIASLFFGWIPVVPFLGVFLGTRAIKQIRATGERGVGVARAGIALGTLTGLFVVALAVSGS